MTEGIERMELTRETLKSRGFKETEEVEWGYIYRRNGLECEILINGTFEIKPVDESNLTMKELQSVNDKIRSVKNFVFSYWREKGHYV